MTASPEKTTIFIIEDDPLMAECIARVVTRAFPLQNVKISQSPKSSQTVTPPQQAIKTFPDAISATAALADELPDLIFLDILLNGPDGFTFLNETISYSDTARIPVILVTSLNLADHNLEHYGVRVVLNKDTMTPADIQEAARNALVPAVGVQNAR